ncbi:MAG: hypothetical protein JWQ66_2388 [Mucilaginibacter sp.]|nr:hypothetical protein [Mucilaginibacter sp.]
MENSNNSDCLNIPFWVVDRSKSIVSFNPAALGDIRPLFLKTPSIGLSIEEILPRENALIVCDLLDNCLAGKLVVVAASIVDQLIVSFDKVQMIFIPVSVNIDLSYAVCVILPNLYTSVGDLFSEGHSRFISHKLRAPVSSLLYLSEFDNHTDWDCLDDVKIKRLLKDIYIQAEKLNEIVINLSALVDVQEAAPAENMTYEKLPLNHIVLVDDDPLIIMVHKMILSKFKKDALTVDFVNPLNALAYINANNPDIVFLDINMPEMNAWEFLNRLEKDLSFIAPVIIISSSIDPSERLRAYSYKCVREFISKPLTYEKLQTLFY